MNRMMSTTLVIDKEQELFHRNGLKTFSDFMDFQGGKVATRQRGRTVTRFELGNRAFYLKRNEPNRVELLKTLSHFKLPPRNAPQEWANILAVSRIGIPTVSPIAMGEQTFMGMEISSFILTEELYETRSLEEIAMKDFAGELSPSMRKKKRSLISQTAQIARKLHNHGMNHQDFYLSHFFFAQDETLYLLDLQRVVRRKKVPKRYLIKDLGQLNFAADYVGTLSRTDRLRFFLEYRGKASLDSQDKKIIKRILAKTDRIARHTVKLLERRRRRGELPKINSA